MSFSFRSFLTSIKKHSFIISCVCSFISWFIRSLACKFVYPSFVSSIMHSSIIFSFVQSLVHHHHQLMVNHMLALESNTQLLIISSICRLSFKSSGVYVKVDSMFFISTSKKTFDGCDHSKLWSCLQRYGIHGAVLDIFKSMYGQ